MTRSVVDAAYVALAKMTRAALYTADARLAKAARAKRIATIVTT